MARDLRYNISKLEVMLEGLQSLQPGTWWPNAPLTGRAMLTQAQRQLASLEALEVLEGVVSEMYGE